MNFKQWQVLEMNFVSRARNAVLTVNDVNMTIELQTFTANIMHVWLLRPLNFEVNRNKLPAIQTFD